MKKLTSILLAIAMLVTVLTFAGCQSEVTPESTAPSTSSDAATDSAADDGSSAAEEVNLEGKLTLNGSTSMTQVCSALGEAFMAKYEGVTVEKASTGFGRGRHRSSGRHRPSSATFPERSTTTRIPTTSPPSPLRSTASPLWSTRTTPWKT